MSNVKDADGVEVLGIGMHFEDFTVGRRFRNVGRNVTESDVINFVNTTGFTEVLFTNLEFLAAHSDIKGRVAPAALVFSFAEGLLVQATLQHTGYAFLGMNLKVEKPTLVGDTIHVDCEVIEARRSKSRPTRGLVRTKNLVVNQKGETVITYDPLRLIKCREAEA